MTNVVRMVRMVPRMNPELNRKQHEAATAPHIPLLIVAGAGTGKTKTLTYRIAQLIQSGVKPERICALTFTNKAAREMAERVRALVTMTHDNDRDGGHGHRDAFGALGVFLGTFHSFGARILRQEAQKVSRTPQFVIFDDTDSFQTVKKLLKERGVDREDAGPAQVAGIFSAIKNGMTTLADIQSERVPAARIAAELFPLYEERLSAMNAFDFDDLIDKTAALLREHPAVAEKYQKRFTHVLVDEYQDLNNRQYDLLRLLVGEARQVSVVGDDQQTIYSWRGSNFEIFMNFERDWPGAQVVVLDQNYRSTGTIIAAASAVVANNKRQKPKQLWTENPPGEPIALVEIADEEEEAGWIAEQVKGERLKVKGDRESDTTAILYRTNAQSRPIEQALIARRIPYRIYGGLKFYERREVKDVVAGLRYAINPADAVSRERLEKAFTKTVFRALAAGLAGHRTAPPAELIQTFLSGADYIAYLKKNTTNAAERLDNIAELVRFAGEFGDTALFLERIALVQSTDDRAAGGRSPAAGKKIAPVTLMTMHMAKGLEFDRVFIAGCVEGVLPHARSLGSAAELEEERRLIYVAMTRAKKRLAVSFYDIPSRFISEIPQELVEYTNLVSDAARFSDSEERYISLD